MVARSLPHIEPSPNFIRELEVKLQACRDQSETGSCANFRKVAAVGALASILMLGYMAQSLPVKHQKHQNATRDIVLSPVIAMAERAQPEIAAGSGDFDGVSASGGAIIASVSAGMPLWPAAVFAEQASLHFASYNMAH